MCSSEPNDREIIDPFAKWYWSLEDRWSDSRDLSHFTSIEQEMLGLTRYNRDVGGNGLADYFAWQGPDFYEATQRGLDRVSFGTFARDFNEFISILKRHQFDYEHGPGVYEFVGQMSDADQGRLDLLQARTADQFDGFYEAWEATYLEHCPA